MDKRTIARTEAHQNSLIGLQNTTTLTMATCHVTQADKNQKTKAEMKPIKIEIPIALFMLSKYSTIQNAQVFFFVYINKSMIYKLGVDENFRK